MVLRHATGSPQTKGVAIMHDKEKKNAELRLLFAMELFAHLTAEQQQAVIEKIISLLSDE